MLSLKNFHLVNTPFDGICLQDNTVLRHFPDAHDRTPNDPTYTVFSENVLKHVRQFDNTIQTRNEVTLQHLLLLRDYALNNGWEEVYLAGRSLVLSAEVGSKIQMDTRGCDVRTTNTDHMVIDITRFLNQCSLISMLPARYLGDPSARITVVGINYCGPSDALVPQRPIALTHSTERNSRVLEHSDMDNSIRFVYDMERDCLEWSHFINVSETPTRKSHECYLFEVEFVVDHPAKKVTD